MPNQDLPTISLAKKEHQAAIVSGPWRVHVLALPDVMNTLQDSLMSIPRDGAVAWDLSGISALDHIGAQLLWNAWGKALPENLVVPEQYKEFFERLGQAGELKLAEEPRGAWLSFLSMGGTLHALAKHLRDFVGLIGQLILDLMQFVRTPLLGPWKEVSANIYHAGYQALGITALVGFLIGVVLSYLSAQQLHTFGADVYLVNILGMSIIRELGPLLAAILVAGRSGSSITAQLGVMRVNEELDAMLVMGMPHGFRLIMPKVVALAIAMPLLVIWTDAMALAGGMTAAALELKLSPRYFLQALPDAVPLANYWIGIGKGFVFGGLIALVACHFGLRIKPNTESLGQGTTISVVTAITAVILADAIFAIIFTDVGY